MFPSFDEWCRGSVAQSTLKYIYEVMERASRKYPDERWRTLMAKEHLRKALLHIASAHHFGLDHVEDGLGAKTNMPEWTHALTRLAFVAALLPKEEPKPIEISTIEEEIKE